MQIEHFFDPISSTMTYLVFDKSAGDAVVIDPVMDFDANQWQIGHLSFNKICNVIEENKLNIRFVMETHVHADHMSGATLFRDKFGCEILIHEAVSEVQKNFQDVFHLDNFLPDGSQFDRLLKDGDVVDAGAFNIQCIYTPGHTPACVSYLAGECLFTGDALFHPSFGTGRCDFPGGDAAQSYKSIKKLYELPNETKIYVGHAYPSKGMEPDYRSTIGESKKSNKWLTADTKQDEFIERRTKRDKELPLPNLLYQALQININAGSLPGADSDGARYLKMPLFGGS